MILNHINPKQLVKTIDTIIKKHAGEDVKTFFFGSRIDGSGDDRSDIDIGIQASHPLSFSTLAAIKEEIDNLPILYTIDIVDFSSASESFRSTALQHIEPFENFL